MKFIKILLVSVAITPGCLFAQKKQGDNSKVRFGIGVGPNLSKASLASYTLTEPGWGNKTVSTYAVVFDINFFVNVKLGKTVFFRPELGFMLVKPKAVVQ